MLNEKAATATFFTNVDTATASKEFMTARNSKNLITRNTLICQDLHKKAPSWVKPSLDKEAIRQALPFARLMAHYGLETFAHDKCRCPFHGEDKKPSATIKNEFFYCYTCGEKHDVFSFIMAMEHCTFQEAVTIGAEIAGVNASKCPRKLARVIAERKHGMAEKKRIDAANDAKYQLLAQVAAKVRPLKPDWMPRLDGLLDVWASGVPDEADMRPLAFAFSNGGRVDALSFPVIRLCDEMEFCHE